MVYLDGEKTERMERMRCIRSLQAGDTLILLTLVDLGAPRERENLLTDIASRGATVTVTGTPARKRNRPIRFDPTPEQECEIAMLWHDPTVPGPYALRRAIEIAGPSATRNALNYRLGARTKPKQTRERG